MPILHQRPRPSRSFAVLLPLAVFLACGDASRHPPVAGSPFALADSLRRGGRSAEAALQYRALRDSFGPAGDAAGRWRAQLGLAEALVRSDPSAARPEVAAARELALGDPYREGWARLLLGSLLLRRGELDSARVELTRTLELAHATGDRKFQAEAHAALASLHARTGRYRGSLLAGERAVILYRELGDVTRELAEALATIGAAHERLGQLEDAARAYDEAAGIYRRIGDPFRTAMALFNLGRLRSAFGELEQALDLMLQSRGHLEQVGKDWEERMRLFVGIAELYTKAGNSSAARGNLYSALEIARALEMRREEALTLEKLGRLELAVGRPASALSPLHQALALVESVGFEQERVTVRAVLGRAYAALGEVDSATRVADGALRIAERLADPAVELEALEAKAVALEAAGSGLAADAYVHAIDFLETWRGRVGLGDLRLGVLEPRLGVYEGAIRTLLTEGRAGEAFEVAERARARLLLELMADAPLDSQPAFHRKVTADAMGSSALEVEAGAREQVAVEIPGPAPLTDLQAGLLRPGRTILAFFWGDRDVYGWRVTRDAVQGARLGPTDSLGALVAFLRGAIEEPSQRPDWRAVARRAFRELIAPLSPIPEGEILVVPDGHLAYIPIEVLIPADGALPWGASRRIVYGPSASLLLALTRAPRSARWEQAVLAVGNPVPTRASDSWGAEDADRQPLPPLPYAEAEARAISRLFRSDGADVLLGRRATFERWLALGPARYRYIHFAAHARVDNLRPQRTHLVLADRLLDLRALRQLRLTAELVTLSACETALGRQVRGEGVVGLPHAFIAAGARSVLVTLWRVEDRSTADFMRDFYRELRSGLPPADALLAVRRARLAAPDLSAHPSRWAAFVLIGGPKETLGSS